MAAEDGQPESGIVRQRDGEADQRGAEEPGARILDRVAVVTTSPTRIQTTTAAAKNAEVRQPVARFHDHRV